MIISKKLCLFPQIISQATEIINDERIHEVESQEIAKISAAHKAIPLMKIEEVHPVRLKQISINLVTQMDRVPSLPGTKFPYHRGRVVFVDELPNNKMMEWNTAKVEKLEKIQQEGRTKITAQAAILLNVDQQTRFESIFDDMKLITKSTIGLMLSTRFAGNNEAFHIDRSGIAVHGSCSEVRTGIFDPTATFLRHSFVLTADKFQCGLTANVLRNGLISLSEITKNKAKDDIKVAKSEFCTGWLRKSICDEKCPEDFVVKTQNIVNDFMQNLMMVSSIITFENIKVYSHLCKCWVH